LLRISPKLGFAQYYQIEIKCPYCKKGTVFPRRDEKKKMNILDACEYCKVLFVIKDDKSFKLEIEKIDNPSSRRHNH